MYQTLFCFSRSYSWIRCLLKISCRLKLLLSYASSKQTRCNQPIRTNRPIVRSFSSAMPPFQDPPTRRYVPNDKDNYLETNKRISRYLPRCTRPPDIPRSQPRGKDMHKSSVSAGGKWISFPIDLGVQLHPFLGFENYPILFSWCFVCIFVCVDSVMCWQRRKGEKRRGAFVVDQVHVCTPPVHSIAWVSSEQHTLRRVG